MGECTPDLEWGKVCSCYLSMLQNFPRPYLPFRSPLYRGELWYQYFSVCSDRFGLLQMVLAARILTECTTFLHYTQNMMESNLILLLTLTALCFQYDWLRTGRTESLVIGSLTLGANLGSI